ncbi:4Fe-4S binding protein [Methanobrevibacter filiformis]|uniref:NAD(P)H-quinone oxidoreductase subunit I, chloroplastic n=1 Tax=Methanobrevibacter filiformis TaxID=55758 RepID=A0A166C0I8_9EURY|nr:4Fe-4S binding protein [Methanobrevibacter filiformis]KZX14004.1 NAD(P)H-quinone oxidoreductase subunit I, chloroplastic [Methanobrevibacter filiformis]
MKNLIRIMLEGAYGNFKRIFFARDRVTDMEMRKNILEGKIQPTDKVAIDACIGCGGCANVCPTNAIEMAELAVSEELMPGWTKSQVPKLNSEKCVFCYYCHDFCPVYALFGEKSTIHPNDVGEVKLDLKTLMDQPVKISDDKLSFISQFLSDKTILKNKK